MELTPQEDQIKTTVCLVLYKWAVCVPPPLYLYIYIIPKILCCDFIRKNFNILQNNLNISDTFVKYVFNKKKQLLILCWKINENREEVAWL